MKKQNEKESWEIEFDRLSKLEVERGGFNIPYEGYYDPELKKFIHSTLSNQRSEIVEKINKNFNYTVHCTKEELLDLINSKDNK